MDEKNYDYLSLNWWGNTGFRKTINTMFQPIWIPINCHTFHQSGSRNSFPKGSPWILNNVFPSTRISASCLRLFLCVAAVTVCVRPLSSNLSKSAAVGGCLGQVFKGWRSKQVSPCTPSNEHDQWTNRIDDWYRCAITCQTQNPESSSHNIWCWKTERRNTGEKFKTLSRRVWSSSFLQNTLEDLDLCARHMTWLNVGPHIGQANATLRKAAGGVLVHQTRDQPKLQDYRGFVDRPSIYCLKCCESNAFNIYLIDLWMYSKGLLARVTLFFQKIYIHSTYYIYIYRTSSTNQWMGKNIKKTTLL